MCMPWCMSTSVYMWKSPNLDVFSIYRSPSVDYVTSVCRLHRRVYNVPNTIQSYVHLDHATVYALDRLDTPTCALYTRPCVKFTVYITPPCVCPSMRIPQCVCPSYGPI